MEVKVTWVKVKVDDEKYILVVLLFYQKNCGLSESEHLKVQLLFSYYDKQIVVLLKMGEVKD